MIQPDVNDLHANGVDIRKSLQEDVVPMVAPAPQPTPAAGSNPRAVVARMSDVEPGSVDWLWHPYIPRRALTLLDADPGTGKSTLARWLAARLSTGGLWPDGSWAHQCNVGLIGDEDGLETSVRPHLELLGADMDRIVAVQGIPTGGPGSPLRPIELRDVTQLDALMAEHKPGLVVVDPLQAHIGADVDLNRSNETRPVLAGVARLAEKHGCAVVIVRHLSKGGAGGKGVYRGLGSIDIIGAARSALALHRHPDPERRDVRVLAHSKCNAARLGPSLEFSIGDGGRIEWLGESSVRDADLREAEVGARPGGGKRGRPAEARELAEEWLREALADGPVATQRLLALAEDAGHNDRTVRRAAAILGVEIRRPRPGKEGAPGVPGTWTLPATAEVEAETDSPATEVLARAREGSLYGTPERESAPAPRRANKHPPRATTDGAQSPGPAHAEGNGAELAEACEPPDRALEAKS